MTLVGNHFKYSYLCILLFACSCNSDFSFKNFTGYTFGTYYDIKVFSEKEILLSEENFDSIFLAFNNSFSTYKNSSIISRLNNGDDVDIDDLFFDVYNKSKILNSRTNGLFDPTIGLLIEYYGFGPENSKNIIDEDSILQIMETVGFEKISINNRELIKENIKTKLDFNAIAKGYAVDVISNYIESKGHLDYLIDIGGEIKSAGTNVSKKDHWKIAINNPDLNNPDSFYKILRLSNHSIATSGNYRNYKIDSLTGNKYVHILNPITGKSQQTNILSASVVSSSCFKSDAFATAMMATNLKNAISLTENNNDIESFIIYVDSLNNITNYASAGFKKLLLKP